MGKAKKKKQEADVILADLTADRCLKDPSIMKYPRVVQACKKYSKVTEKIAGAQQAKADADTSAATTALIAGATSSSAPTDTGAVAGTEEEKFLGMPKTTGYAVVGVGTLVVLGVVGFLAFGGKGGSAPAPVK